MRLSTLSWFPIPVCALLAVCAASNPVRAEAADAETRTAARELAREAAELATSGRCDTAVDRFRRAYSLVPAPTIAVHEARCLVQLGRLLEAVDRYEQVQRAPLEASAPTAFTEALEEARTALVALRPRIPRLRIEVSGVDPDNPSLEVKLNDRELPRALLGIDRPIDPGEYRISATAEGKTPADETVNVKEGENQVIELELGAPTEKKPKAEPKEPVAPAVEESEPAPIADRSAPGRTWGWVLVGVGVAGIGGGVATALLAQSKEQSLEQSCNGLECPKSSQSDLDSMKLFQTLSFVGYGVGIAGVVSGTVLVLASSGGSTESARTEFGVGLSSAYVRGTF